MFKDEALKTDEVCVDGRLVEQVVNDTCDRETDGAVIRRRA